MTAPSAPPNLVVHNTFISVQNPDVTRRDRKLRTIQSLSSSSNVSSVEAVSPKVSYRSPTAASSHYNAMSPGMAPSLASWTSVNGVPAMPPGISAPAMILPSSFDQGFPIRKPARRKSAMSFSSGASAFVAVDSDPEVVAFRRDSRKMKTWTAAASPCVLTWTADGEPMTISSSEPMTISAPPAAWANGKSCLMTPTSSLGSPWGETAFAPWAGGATPYSVSSPAKSVSMNTPSNTGFSPYGASRFGGAHPATSMYAGVDQLPIAPPAASIPMGKTLSLGKKKAAFAVEFAEPPTEPESERENFDGKMASNVVVKNTFIDVQEDQDLGSIARRSRRRSTVPSIPSHEFDVVEEGVPAQIVLSPRSPIAQTFPLTNWGKVKTAAPVGFSPPVGLSASPAFAPVTLPNTTFMSGPVLAGPPGVWVTSPSSPAIVTMGAPHPMPANLLPASSKSVAGNVWALSQDAAGCRMVQAALDQEDDYARDSITTELHGHIFEALHNPHANFVVRKCVEKLPAPSLQFIVNELLSVGTPNILEAARHRYGCRIIEALFERCPSYQLEQVADILLSDASGLSGHMYGNFVMQKMLQYSAPYQQSQLVEVLCTQAATLGPNFYCSAVYGTALKSVPIEDRVRVALALTNGGALPVIARFKHGGDVVQSVLQYLDPGSCQAVNFQLATAAAQRQQAAVVNAASAQAKVVRTGAGKQAKQRANTGQHMGQARVLRGPAH